LNLSEGLKSCATLGVPGATDVVIRQIVTDSRKVNAGDLFVALPGTKQNGRQFIGEAVRRGAAAVVYEGELSEGRDLQGKRPSRPVALVQVKDAHEALFHLASYFFGNPAKDLRLTGVTGTNGKTTTTFLIQSILNADLRKTGLIGTIGYDCGNGTFLSPDGGTTPGIMNLQTLFSQMKQQGTTDVAMEVSSHALDQRRTLGLTFNTAVFTNLTQDHLDYHQTMEHYFEAKKKLFSQVSGASVINVDDPWGMALKNEVTGSVLGYGIHRHESIYPRSITSNLSGIEMVVATPIGDIVIASPLTGQYNVYNLLAAIGVGVASGLSREAIAAGAASMKSVPGRFERIDLGQDFLVVVDYAHTEDALARLLASVASLSLGHVITVVGCGGDRDRGKRPKMAKVASLYSRLSILTSDNPRSEPPEAIIKEMEAGLLSQNPRPLYEVIPDRKEAIARAIGVAERGDAVVIAGKGHEPYQIIGDRILHFDDREAAREALSEKLYIRRG
jgi:UDP-N-acetylmuramoyl-L-alanyl-D-glutamate--2,6-diaminopimelate ligase